MRWLFPLILLFLFDLYAFQAFQLLASDWSSFARNLLFAVYWSIPAIVVLIGLAFANSDVSQWRNLFNVLRAVLTIAYLAKLLLVGVLLIDDLRRLLFSAYDGLAGNVGIERSRSLFMAQFGVLLAGIPFVTLLYGMIRNRYRYRIFKERVTIPNLPTALEGLRIVQISDIHSGSFTEKMPIVRGIEMINAQQPDLVFFTGDLVNSVAAEMREYISIFKNIKARYGVFSITGNHDYGDYVQWPNQEAKRNNFVELIQTHKALGWDLLLNENRLLDIQGGKVAVIGVENFSAQARFSKYGDLAAAYDGVEGADLRLLLSHDPSHWEYQVVKDFKDIDITFSGHTHGMQFGIEIPGWIRWSPIKYVYKQWAGLYQKGRQYLYVNRGFGFLGYPGRVGILPEITVLELTGQSR